MKEYKIDKSNKLIVKIGQIEEEKGDLLLCWTAITLKTGPDSFYKIHRRAGAQVLSSFVLLEPYVKQSFCFTSIAGLTDFYAIVHSILPIHPAMFNDSFYNIVKTIKKYKEQNVCRNLYFTFPTINKKLIIESLLTYSMTIDNFSFVIIVDDEKEFNLTTKVIEDKLSHNSLFHRFKSFFRL